jgi:xanthine dehydrogenase accessory factor
VPVTIGMKIGDLDPRAEPVHAWTISDKSLAIGGGVLEAILQNLSQTPTMHRDEAFL